MDFPFFLFLIAGKVECHLPNLYTGLLEDFSEPEAMSDEAIWAQRKKSVVGMSIQSIAPYLFKYLISHTQAMTIRSSTWPSFAIPAITLLLALDTPVFTAHRLTISAKCAKATRTRMRVTRTIGTQ